MDGGKSFFDLCINYECFTKNYNETMDLLLEYGYKTIAVNYTINMDEVQDESKKKKKDDQKKIDDIIHAPKPITHNEKYSGINFINRLTVVFSQNIIHKMLKSVNYNKYDIIALSPLTQDAFQCIFGTLDADILSFSYLNKVNFRLNRKFCNKLIAKGMYFEISYHPLLINSTQRRNCIFLSHLLHTFAKSRHVIVTSAADNYTQLRSPYDVINLGFILGLSQQQAKDAVTHCQAQVYLNAVGKRHGKTIAYIENVTCIISDDDEVIEYEPEIKKNKM